MVHLCLEKIYIQHINNLHHLINLEVPITKDLIDIILQGAEADPEAIHWIKEDIEDIVAEVEAVQDLWKKILNLLNTEKVSLQKGEAEVRVLVGNIQEIIEGVEVQVEVKEQEEVEVKVGTDIEGEVEVEVDQEEEAEVEADEEVGAKLKVEILEVEVKAEKEIRLINQNIKKEIQKLEAEVNLKINHKFIHTRINQRKSQSMKILLTAVQINCFRLLLSNVIIVKI